MKPLWKLFVGILLLAEGHHGVAQPLMGTVYDAHKLKENELLFVDQPLHVLLKEIGPDIKTVFTESNRPHKAPSYIIFKFIDQEEQQKYKLAGKRSLSILIYIKESFDWNKPKDEVLKWTNQDTEKYGHLTVMRIAILGEVYDESLSL